ncbi:hypothetical protein DFJ77DRAFT_354046 [Powellomyces hirtus]|nr:hypothetical protein DFJ77DRAFT_354046 [Powellomyces hirtus]
MTDAAGDLLGFPLTPVWKAYLALIPTFSALSIFSSMVALTVYVCMRKFSPKAANRVSLRLAALISVADIGYNSAWFTLQYSLEMGRDGPCKTAGWFLIFCGLVSVFTTFAIGLNIFLIFVLKLHSTPVFEISYNVIAITLAGLLATVSIASGRFGYNGWECWFMGKEEELKASDEYIGNAFGFYYGWILAACVCCAVFIAMFWWVLKQNQRGLQQGTGGGGGIEKESGTSAASGLANQSKARANRKMTKMINRTVGRISWYCVVPIAAQLSNVAYDFIMRAGGFDYWCILPTCVSVVWLSVLTAALQVRLPGGHDARNTISFIQPPSEALN